MKNFFKNLPKINPIQTDETEESVIQIGKPEPTKEKVISCEIKNFNEKERTFEAIASTDGIDRDGDILTVEGWKLNEYRKNPVILWGHDGSIPALGQSKKIWKDTNTLRFIPKFAPAEVHPFADQIFQLYKEGILRAFSVRFDPYKWEDLPGDPKAQRQYYGRKYTLHGLLEISSVNVPANGGALISREYQEMLVKEYQLNIMKEFDSETQQKIFTGLGISKCANCQANKPPQKYTLTEESQKQVTDLIADLNKILGALDTVKGMEVIKPAVDDIIDNTKNDILNGEIKSMTELMAENKKLIARLGLK